MNCPICDGGPNGHTFGCATLNLDGKTIDATLPKEVVLFSGGMDSLIAWEIVGRPPALYVDLGHKYSGVEIQRCQEIIPEVQFFHLEEIGQRFELPSAEIPLRNLYLAMVAANLGYDRIWLSVQRNEMTIPDRSEEFFSMASNMLTMLMDRPIEVRTPVADLDKTEMVQWYVEHEKDIGDLKRTWACYQPVNVIPLKPGVYRESDWQEHCGDCPACFRRFIAMKLNGIHEDWHVKVPTSQTANDYKLRALAGEYPEDRADQILKALS